MSGDQGSEFETLAVHVVNQPKAKQPVYRTVYLTVTLTADEPTKELLPAARDRKVALVQALDDDVVISGNKGDASAGAGSIISTSNTGFTPLHDHGPVYVSAPSLAGATSKVSVIVTYVSME